MDGARDFALSGSISKAKGKHSAESLDQIDNEPVTTSFDVSDQQQCQLYFQSNQKALKAVMRPGNIPKKYVHCLLQNSTAVVWLIMS